MPIPDSIVVWVCPDCGNYYASSNAGDLRESFNKDIKGDITFSRARCPTLGCAAQEVQRIPLRVQLSEVLHNEPKTEPIIDASPHWSGQFCVICAKQLIATDNLLVCSGCGKVTDGQSYT